MKILISTGIFPNRASPHRGIYILRQAVALSKLAGVKVIAPVPFFPSFARSARYSSYSRVPENDNFDGIEVAYPRYYVLPKIMRYAHGALLEASINGTFRRLAREFVPDVVLGFFAYPYGYGSVRIARRLGLPVVTGVLGSDLNVMPRGVLHRKMIAWTLRSSDRVFSVCESLKKKAIELGAIPERVVVIPNGVEEGQFGRSNRDEARSRLQLDSGGRFVLCVSNLVPIKGVDILVRAMLSVTDDVKLVVVGDGAELDRLRRLAVRIGVSERILFAGKQPPDDVPLWMAAANVVALASRAEGHPNVILESLASGTPVVATRVGGVPEILTSERFGVVVEPEDPEALASGIRAALSSEWDDAVLRREGQRRTWDDVAREIVAELDRTVVVRSSEGPWRAAGNLTRGCP
jgi:glycosyltransferase involved in cell wall biosynthesis